MNVRNVFLIVAVFMVCQVCTMAQELLAIQQISWSPKGDKICFTAKATKSDELFVIHTDGTGLKQLTNDELRDAHPSWSHDGTTIVYSKDIKKYDPRLYVINPDGTGEKCLFDDGYSDSFGTYSPDDTRLAYMSKRDTHWQLFMYNFKDKSRTQILTSDANDFNPVWSYDGKNIGFESDRNGNDQDDIFILNLPTGKLKQVTNSQEYNDVYPFFSPVSNQLLFLSLRNRIGYLFTINPDGTAEKKIAEKVLYASWSPDGKKIAFISYKNGIDKRSVEIINLKQGSIIEVIK